MEVIVDANILLAGFLKDATARELLLDARLRLFAPEHLIMEITSHLQSSAKLRKRIPLSPEKLQDLFELLTQKIQTVSAASYKSHFLEAASLAPHEEDAHYFALAMLLGIPIWSNDKGMKTQARVKIYSTHELIAILENWPQ